MEHSFDVNVIMESIRVLVLPPESTVIESEDILRKAIAAFNEDFGRCQEIFRHLNAYKGLHDVLHQLRAYFPMLETEIQSRIKDPSQQLSEEVKLFLDKCLESARRIDKDIGFPETTPPWIAWLSESVQGISGSDVEQIPLHFERLRHLISRGMAEINDRLVSTANSPRLNQQIVLMDEILAGLRQSKGSKWLIVQRPVEKMRASCVQLNELIGTHNLCQTIDRSLREAKGLVSVNPADLPDWDFTMKSLYELAALRHNDARLRRTLDAARLFEAGRTQAFPEMVVHFEDLFMQIDKALLGVTNQLVTETVELHRALDAVN